MQIPQLPLARFVEQAIAWMHLNLATPFHAIGRVIVMLEGLPRFALLVIPPPVLIGTLGLVIAGLAGIRTALLASLGLLLVWDLHLWRAAMDTLSLVLVAGGLSLLVGIPAGILIGESRTARAIVTPLLDYMQTTPSFVYLIPSVMLFGLGTVPGVLATTIFSMPPPVRTTALGLRQVGREVIEAGEAFGCTRWQLLRKVKLPLAFPSILLGVNQCIMMSLSMVVTASLIGAPGLGRPVIESISRVNVSQGIEAGVAVVVLAMILDRTSRGAARGRADMGWL